MSLNPFGIIKNIFGNNQKKSSTNQETIETKKEFNLDDFKVGLEHFSNGDYGDLLSDVQISRIFSDGKTFVDCVPKKPVEEIIQEYRSLKKEQVFNLGKFISENFELPSHIGSEFISDTTQATDSHIENLWNFLTREPDGESGGSLIPLPRPYIVPGGRFREIYYWDSFFTMLGLRVSGKVDMIQNMIDNFAYLIDTYGFIPNGNRSYFLSRSQPPFFALMVNLLAQIKQDQNILLKYLPQMEAEHKFWMDGKNRLSKDNISHRRVVLMPNDLILNRYWDDLDTPRSEMYLEDLEIAQKIDFPKGLYRDIRAACESGWDFSSRWLHGGDSLIGIHTTEIIPIDLNCVMYYLEQTLAKACNLKGDMESYTMYNTFAYDRKTAILEYCWSDKKGFFFDYDFVEDSQKSVISAAGIFPLYFGITNQEQAESIAQMIEKKLLAEGGLVSTDRQTNQQWDQPNGWAPLQYIAVRGLEKYGLKELADKIKYRWLDVNETVYRETGKMAEKYNVLEGNLKNAGGEYPVQDGFGWTNGVYLDFLQDTKTDTDN